MQTPIFIRVLILLFILSYASALYNPLHNNSLFLNQNNSKVISVPLKWNEYKMPGINISIGTPQQTFEFLISTFSSRLYISKLDGFTCEDSLTCIDHKTTIDLNFTSCDVKGILTTDTIYLNGIMIENFNFIQVSRREYINMYKGMIGLEYFDNERYNIIDNPINYSLLSMLYYKKFIEAQIFSIGNFNKKDILFLGGYGIDKKDINYRNYRICDLIKNKDNENTMNLWKCKLNSIFFEDGSIYKIDDDIAFGISNSCLTVNKAFFDFIVEKFFSKEIKMNLCSVTDDLNIYSIWCRPSYNTKSIGIISLVIGKWNLKIDTSKLWTDTGYRGSKEFSIIYHSDKKYIWSINYNLIKNEYIMVFDKESNKFGLITNKVSK